MTISKNKYLTDISAPLVGFFQALGVFVYTVLISSLFLLLPNVFQKQSQFFAPVFMLTLLVFSAAITGLLVFGYPAYLALNSKIKEALMVLLYTFLWMLVLLVIILTVVSLF